MSYYKGRDEAIHLERGQSFGIPEMVGSIPVPEMGTVAPLPAEQPINPS